MKKAEATPHHLKLDDDLNLTMKTGFQYCEVSPLLRFMSVQFEVKTSQNGCDFFFSAGFRSNLNVINLLRDCQVDFSYTAQNHKSQICLRGL